ncbi:MAG: glycosyltransferase family 4 protein [Candidatus Nitrosotenuis sp.]
MRLLIAGAKSKFFHLKEFGDALKKFGVEYKLVHDLEIYTGFPSKNIRNWFPSKKKFNALISEFKPNAVFVDRQAHLGLAAIEAKIPLFILLRGDYWSEIKWAKETLYKSPIRRVALWKRDKIAQACFAGATAILPICRYLEPIVKKHYPEKSIHVLYGGIDSSRWYQVAGMKLEHPCVGLLQGAWIWGKTQEMLTLKNVVEALPHVTFYWVGDGPYRQKITDVLGKYKNFRWFGALQYPDQVREYLASIDVYALASGIDMSPLTLQEAQLMNKPVIATNAGGIPELMIDSKTGFLIERGDYKIWIEKITTLLENKKLAQEFGQNGRQFVVENFSWEKMAKNFIRILEAHL